MDYSTIVRVPRLDNKSLPTKPPAHPPSNPLGTAHLAIVVNAAIDATINPNLAESTCTIDATNTEPTSFDNSNIYNKLDNNLSITLTTFILPLELASQVLQVLQLQAISQTQSLAFDYFITTLLDNFYIS